MVPVEKQSQIAGVSCPVVGRNDSAAIRNEALGILRRHTDSDNVGMVHRLGNK